MTSQVSHRLIEKFYTDEEHPYRIFLGKIREYTSSNAILVDAGCGADAVVLRKLGGTGAVMVGLEISDLTRSAETNAFYLLNNDLRSICLKSNCTDIVISRSVLEHVQYPIEVYREVNRILKQGGYFIFLVPNLLDYACLASRLVPNRFHAWIVRKTEGRNEGDTFSTYYRSNTSWSVRHLATASGFSVEDIRFLGQYPSYFLFNPLLFLMGTMYDKVVCRFSALRFLRGWLLCILRKCSQASNSLNR